MDGIRTARVAIPTFLVVCEEAEDGISCKLDDVSPVEVNPADDPASIGFWEGMGLALS